MLADAMIERQRLNQIADVAALSAVSYGYLTQTAASAQQAAKNLFTAGATQSQATIDTSLTVVSVTDSNFIRTAKVSYTAYLQLPLLGLFNMSSMTIAGSSSATTALPTYIDFYMLLDNTPSMGIAATTQDIQTMVNNTSDQCAFACHDISNAGHDYYALAKSLGVTMRIDVVRQAAQSLMDTVSTTEAVSNQYRIAIYTFGSSATSEGLTTIAPLSADLTTVKNQANAIDLMTVPYSGYNNDQNTDLDGMLSAMNSAISTPGDGSSANSPQKVMFLVSDGVSDASYPSTCTKQFVQGTYRCQEPLTVADCTAIKNRGIRIAVLYTTYYPLTTNSWYNTYISPFQSQIATNMQSCASSGLYFEVSPSQGISAAMNALFQTAVQTARLTQ